MKKVITLFLCVLMLMEFSKTQGQERDSVSINKKQLNTLVIGGTSLYTISMTGLYFVWYDQDTQTNFHFFNDNPQWKQVDKVGHFYSAYHISRTSAELFRWANMKDKKAMFWGTMTGIALMTPIEIFDGFSEEYGASWGDFVANTGGSLFLYTQYMLWDEIRIHPKFSFGQTEFASQRPEVLGDGWTEEWLKDYNGQTYWLSFDIDKFLPQNSKYPKWLNIALGYGAENMLAARDEQNLEMGFRPYRQYYLGVDFDLQNIKTQKKWIKSLLFLANMIRLPAPALEYNRNNGLKFHWIKF